MRHSSWKAKKKRPKCYTTRRTGRICSCDHESHNNPECFTDRSATGVQCTHPSEPLQVGPYFNDVIGICMASLVWNFFRRLDFGCDFSSQKPPSRGDTGLLAITGCRATSLDGRRENLFLSARWGLQWGDKLTSTRNEQPLSTRVRQEGSFDWSSRSCVRIRPSAALRWRSCTPSPKYIVEVFLRSEMTEYSSQGRTMIE